MSLRLFPQLAFVTLVALCVLVSNLSALSYDDAYSDPYSEVLSISEARQALQNSARSKGSLSEQLRSLDPCEKEILKLGGQCLTMSREDMQRIAIELTNCNLELFNRPRRSCSKDSPIRECLQSWEDRDMLLFANYEKKVEDVCVFVWIRGFDAFLENHVMRLSRAGERLVDDIALARGQLDANSMILDTFRGEMHDFVDSNSKDLQELLRKLKVTQDDFDTLKENTGITLEQATGIQNVMQDFSLQLLELQKSISESLSQSANTSVKVQENFANSLTLMQQQSQLALSISQSITLQQQLREETRTYAEEEMSRFVVLQETLNTMENVTESILQNEALLVTAQAQAYEKLKVLRNEQLQAFEDTFYAIDSLRVILESVFSVVETVLHDLDTMLLVCGYLALLLLSWIITTTRRTKGARGQLFMLVTASMSCEIALPWTPWAAINLPTLWGNVNTRHLFGVAYLYIFLSHCFRYVHYEKESYRLLCEMVRAQNANDNAFDTRWSHLEDMLEHNHAQVDSQMKNLLQGVEITNILMSNIEKLHSGWLEAMIHPEKKVGKEKDCVKAVAAARGFTITQLQDKEKQPEKQKRSQHKQKH